MVFSPYMQELLMEVSRREKEAGIVPDPDLDAYMKVLFSPFFSVHLLQVFLGLSKTKVKILRLCML